MSLSVNNSLTLTNPPSPTSTADSSDAPRTPGENISAELANSLSNSNNSSKPARKPSRRANTAERRATHNAVERQRRETLNGRFLDLAALLPNLSQIRRPSKSAIVNSSIAHIHASRRHRMLASRELRLVKMEADALRRELNEWRDRAGIPRVEEPQRGDGFGVILSGELEVVVPAGAEGMEEDDEDGGYMGTYDDTSAAASYDAYDQQQQQQQRASPVYGQPQVPVLQQPQRPASIQLPPAMHPHAAAAASLTGHPMIASPTAMAFENPALGYYAQQQQHVQQQSAVPQQQIAEEKWMYHQMLRGRERSGSLSSSNSAGNGGGNSPGMEWMGGAGMNGMNVNGGMGGQGIGVGVGGGMGLNNNVAFAPMF